MTLAAAEWQRHSPGRGNSAEIETSKVNVDWES